MGKLVYGSPSISVEIDDRTLAHLKVVMVAKLRRGESFMFTWAVSVADGSGHTSVWLNSGIPLQFEFNGNREPAINRKWLDELVQLSNSPAGLRITPEPIEGQKAP